MNLDLMLPDIISVGLLNRMTRDILESALPPVWISGELSNVNLAPSGHAYFSLKDSTAQVRCVLFKYNAKFLPFKLGNGVKVELKGVATLYEARGEFQINVEQIRPSGLGGLYQAFEALKAKLQSEGLFDVTRKRELPRYPRAIGIITSPAAAALRDMVSTLARRMPNLPIILYPTLVQGEQAAPAIVAAIEIASQRKEVDVLIVGRGGGSIEDLWPFNEEIVARAIASCPIPIISGVGHETDFTIADFVADQRAPTPTAAAELASPDRYYLLQKMHSLRQQMERQVTRILTQKQQTLDFLTRRLIHPATWLKQQHEHMLRLKERLSIGIEHALLKRTWRLEQLSQHLRQVQAPVRHQTQILLHYQQRLQLSQQRYRQQQHQRVAHLQAALQAFNPEAVLERGYAIIQKQNGHIPKSVTQLSHNEKISLRLANGSAEAWVDKTHPDQSALPF